LEPTGNQRRVVRSESFLDAARACFPAEGTSRRNAFEVFERLVLQPFEDELRLPGRYEALHEEIPGSPVRTFVTAPSPMVPIVCFFLTMVGEDVVLLDLGCDYDSWHADENDDLLDG